MRNEVIKYTAGRRVGGFYRTAYSYSPAEGLLLHINAECECNYMFVHQSDACHMIIAATWNSLRRRENHLWEKIFWLLILRCFFFAAHWNNLFWPEKRFFNLYTDINQNKPEKIRIYGVGDLTPPMKKMKTLVESPIKHE